MRILEAIKRTKISNINMAMIYMKQNDFKNALKCYKKSKALDLQDIHNMSVCYIECNEAQKGINILESILIENSNELDNNFKSCIFYSIHHGYKKLFEQEKIPAYYQNSLRYLNIAYSFLDEEDKINKKHIKLIEDRMNRMLKFEY